MLRKAGVKVVGDSSGDFRIKFQRQNENKRRVNY